MRIVDDSLNWLVAGVPAGYLQSLCQLGVAVSLAYLVAGPQVMLMLKSPFAGLDALEALIDQISAMHHTPDPRGEPAREGIGGDLASRRMIISSARYYFGREAENAVPSNPHTATY